MILTRCHANVVAAADAAEAMRLLPSERWDLIVSDIAMPGEDGYSLMAHIRETLGVSAPPVIALTAFGAPEDRKRIIEAGFERHLMKPVDPFILARTVDAVIGARRAASRRRQK